MKKKIQTFLAIFTLASGLFLVVGLFAPHISLFWDKGVHTKRKSAIIYSVAFVSSFILFGLTSDIGKEKL